MLPSSQNLPASWNTSTADNNIRSYLVLPKNPDKVSEVQDILDRNVFSGPVKTVTSDLSPQFDGVEVWDVDATLAEILEVIALVGNDVSFAAWCNDGVYHLVMLISDVLKWLTKMQAKVMTNLPAFEPQRLTLPRHNVPQLGAPRQQGK